MYKLVAIIFIAFTSNGFAQNVEFPRDQTGKYSFTDVVDLKGMSKDELFINGEKFMKKIKVLHSKTKYLKVNNADSQIFNRGSFYVYRRGSIKKGIAGAVEYDIALDFKDDKYRYTISGFQFNEYQKNRYGKYEPIKGKYTPLEMEVSSLKAKEWEAQKEVVFDKTQELIVNLDGDMIYAEEKKSKKEKKAKEW
jgi:hypothetical protein